MKRLGILVLLCMTIFMGCGDKENDISNESSGSYPSVVVVKQVKYTVSDIEAKQDEVGNEIGQVKKIIDGMPTNDGESNGVPVGSKVYAVKGNDNQEQLIIKSGDKFYKATKAK